MTEPMTEPGQMIHTPLGEPGSGRVRYGAAMALFRAGQLPEAVLEVYRICSPLDHQDPGPLLRARGLALPARRAPGAETAIRALLAELAAYLAALPGAGPTEVRAGLAGAAADPLTPPRPAAENPVVAAHLPVALDALGTTHPALAGAIAGAAPHLGWLTYNDYPPEQIGAAFAEGHAFASLIGAEAPIAAADFDAGLFLIAPDILYRDHRHPAPELYLPLTGPHGWRFGPDRPLIVKPAHEPVWNDPMQPHLTKVGPLPFLCLYGWTRDANAPAEVVPASDWAALEALRL